MSDNDKTSARLSSPYTREAVNAFVGERFNDVQNTAAMWGDIAEGKPTTAATEAMSTMRSRFVNFIGSMPRPFQVMLMESDSTRFISTGSAESVGHYARSIGGQYMPGEGFAFTNSGEIIWNNSSAENAARIVSHELVHQFDAGLGRVSGSQGFLSENGTWLEAVRRDYDLSQQNQGNRVAMYDDEGRTVFDRIMSEADMRIRAREALAEMGSHHMIIRASGLSDVEIDAKMRWTYPNMWESYEKNFLPYTEQHAAQLLERRNAITEVYVKSEHALAEAKGLPWGPEQEGVARARAAEIPTSRMESTRIYNWQQADIASGTVPLASVEVDKTTPDLPKPEAQRWGKATEGSQPAAPNPDAAPDASPEPRPTPNERPRDGLGRPVQAPSKNSPAYTPPSNRVPLPPLDMEETQRALRAGAEALPPVDHAVPPQQFGRKGGDGVSETVLPTASMPDAATRSVQLHEAMSPPQPIKLKDIRYPFGNTDPLASMQLMLDAKSYVAGLEIPKDLGREYRQQPHGNFAPVGNPQTPAIMNSSYRANMTGDYYLSISMPDFAKLRGDINVVRDPLTGAPLKDPLGGTKLAPADGLSSMNLTDAFARILEHHGIDAGRDEDGTRVKIAPYKPEGSTYIEVRVSPEDYAKGVHLIDAYVRAAPGTTAHELSVTLRNPPAAQWTPDEAEAALIRKYGKPETPSSAPHVAPHPAEDRAEQPAMINAEPEPQAPAPAEVTHEAATSDTPSMAPEGPPSVLPAPAEGVAHASQIGHAGPVTGAAAAAALAAGAAQAPHVRGDGHVRAVHGVSAGAGAALGIYGLSQKVGSEGTLRKDLEAGGVQAGLAAASTVGDGSAIVADTLGVLRSRGSLGAVARRAALPVAIVAGTLETGAAISARDGHRAATSAGATAGGILGGMAAGAATGLLLGSVVPGAGNVVGAVVGGVAGLAGGLIGAYYGGQAGDALAGAALDRQLNADVDNPLNAMGAQLQRLGYGKLLDKDRDGKIEAHEVRQYVGADGVRDLRAAAKNGLTVSEATGEIKQQLNENYSKQITGLIAEAKAKGRAGELDANHDGKFDMNDIRANLKKTGMKLDANQDGVITGGEFIRAQTTPAKPAQAAAVQAHR